MRLLSKTNRYYLIFTALLLGVVGVAFYFTLTYVIRDEVEDILENELDEFLVKAEEDSNWLHYEQPLEFEIRPSVSQGYEDMLTDTLIREIDDDDYIPYLQLVAYREIRGNEYRIVMRESLIESEEILFAVAVSMGVLFAALLAGLFILNNYLSRILWKPFYLMLDNIRSFHLNSSEKVERITTDIQEFEELNDSLVRMTERMGRDYVTLKEFTENASHEIRTPLAIIKSKIDYLLQDSENERFLIELMKIEKAVNRISKTNQALLLLAKIENNQFQQKELLHIDQMIGQGIEEYEEFIFARRLEVSLNLDPGGTVTASRHLFQILINNLLSNAIRHNVEGGFLRVTLTADKLTIENSGNAPEVNTQKLFERFYKGNQNSDSPGLGLAIIGQICERLHFQIEYHYAELTHRVLIRMNT